MYSVRRASSSLKSYHPNYSNKQNKTNYIIKQTGTYISKPVYQIGVDIQLGQIAQSRVNLVRNQDLDHVRKMGYHHQKQIALDRKVSHLIAKSTSRAVMLVRTELRYIKY